MPESRNVVVENCNESKQAILPLLPGYSYILVDFSLKTKHLDKKSKLLVLNPEKEVVDNFKRRTYPLFWILTNAIAHREGNTSESAAEAEQLRIEMHVHLSKGELHIYPTIEGSLALSAAYQSEVPTGLELKVENWGVFYDPT